MYQFVEPTFEIAYLAVGLIISIYVLIKSRKRIPYLLLGSMGLTLVVCDAMVIIPKMIGDWCFDLQDIYNYVGVGRSAITIVMTTLFVLIYFFYRKVKSKEVNPVMDWFVSVLAVIRIVMTLIPISDIRLAGNYERYFFRNIPFIVMSSTVVFYSYKWTKTDMDYLFEGIEASFIAMLAFFAVSHSFNTTNNFMFIFLFPVVLGIVAISLIKFRFIRKRE